MKTLSLRSLSALLLVLTVVAGCAGGDRAAKDADDVVTADTLAAPVIPVRVPIAPPADETYVDENTLDTTPGRFDLGKMWTFDVPPAAYFKEAYGLDVDNGWFERARLGALRFATYCSASFVSPNGLVMTNHHCARESVVEVSQAGENLLDNGFYAPSIGEERLVPGLFVEQLIEIRDVTSEIDAALRSAQTPAERADARRQALETAAERIGGEVGDARVQIVSLYQGGRYSAYIFRRYNDVRLVMAPEMQVAYYGGDYDNFTYPRYDLDMSYFRVYDEEGNPLHTDHYFPFSATGADEGDPVFVVGNPGSTYRLETVDMLAFRRDIQDRATLDFIQTRLDALHPYYAANPSDELRTRILSLENSLKVYQGRVETLDDPAVMARRQAEEDQFLTRLQASDSLRQAYGNLSALLGAIQQERRAFAPEYRGLIALAPGSSYSSSTMRRALVAAEYLSRKAEGAGADALNGLLGQLSGIESQPAGLEEHYLAARLGMLQRAFQSEPDMLQIILQGRTPEAQAAYLLANSRMDEEGVASALQSGGLTADNDAVVAIAMALYPRLSDFRRAAYGLDERQADALSRLGRARYEVYGSAVPPDATFSLRIADGLVEGYAYNGTYAPYKTTFYGMYDDYYAFAPEFEAWDLPARWVKPPASFDLSTPFNIVSTNDIVGGNSGSPVLNKDLQVIGLAFDGNIESLAGSYIFLPERARTVSVDARGMIEALDDMYDADRLVIELRTGQFFETEAAADASGIRPTMTSSK